MDVGKEHINKGLLTGKDVFDVYVSACVYVVLFSSMGALRPIIQWHSAGNSKETGMWKIGSHPLDLSPHASRHSLV